jgi:hypothetical protein
MYSYRFFRISVSSTFSGVTYLTPPMRKKNASSKATTVMMTAIVVILASGLMSGAAVHVVTAMLANKTSVMTIFLRNRIVVPILLFCIPARI